MNVTDYCIINLHPKYAQVNSAMRQFATRSKHINVTMLYVKNM